MQEDLENSKLGMVRDSRYFGISQILISVGILTTIIAAIGYRILLDKTLRAHRREINNTWRTMNAVDEGCPHHDSSGQVDANSLSSKGRGQS